MKIPDYFEKRYTCNPTDLLVRYQYDLVLSNYLVYSRYFSLAYLFRVLFTTLLSL